MAPGPVNRRQLDAAYLGDSSRPCTPASRPPWSYGSGPALPAPPVSGGGSRSAPRAQACAPPPPCPAADPPARALWPGSPRAPTRGGRAPPGPRTSPGGAFLPQPECPAVGSPLRSQVWGSESPQECLDWGGSQLVGLGVGRTPSQTGVQSGKGRNCPDNVQCARVGGGG